MTETTNPAAELDVLVRTAVEKIDSGSLTLTELLNALAPEDAPAAPPAVLPTPAIITEAERTALARVPEVFGVVVPTERRALQPVEVDALIEEKEILDTIKKMAEKRMTEGIRTAVFNALDVEAEEAEVAAESDKSGHYLLDGTAAGTGATGKKFTREVRTLAPKLDAEALKALADDPDSGFTHEDYLSMTSQVRVLDEAKVMAAIKKNPALVHAVSRATKPGSRSASLNLRKA